MCLNACTCVNTIPISKEDLNFLTMCKLIDVLCFRPSFSIIVIFVSYVLEKLFRSNIKSWYIYSSKFKTPISRKLEIMIMNSKPI